MAMVKYVTTAMLLMWVGLAAVSCGGSNEAAKAPSDVKAERIDGVAETIARFKKKDPSIESFFAKSYGYVVMPSIGEGGFIVGGALGEGDAFRQGAYVGMVTLHELSVGYQLGGQNYAEIVFFETEKRFADLTSGTFEFDVEFLAVAVEAGAAKETEFRQGVASFVLPNKGLMASAAIGGTRLSFYSAR